MAATNNRSAHSQKRHGKHQKHTKQFLHVYLPYIPLLLILVTGIVFTSMWQPHAKKGVLAYATNIGSDSLLLQTNQQRSLNGLSALTINAKLNQAAQAKANDMVTRNYWSHNTPDGVEPWAFFDNAGYAYFKAGENLAFGFMTSSDTITGWMNSPSHRENLLNSSFQEVGFGFANSSDFVNNGNETVVVAEYGMPLAPITPIVSPVVTPPPVIKSTPTVTAVTKPVSTSKIVAEPVAVISPNTDAKPLIEPSTIKVSRLTTVTNGKMPILTTVAIIVSILAIFTLVSRHGVKIHKMIRKGEKYVASHMLLDITLISLIGLCLIVSQTAGHIR